MKMQHFFLSLFSFCLMVISIAIQMWNKHKNKRALIDLPSILMLTGLLLMLTGLWMQYRYLVGVAPSTTASVPS
jgi:hypothetical protein